MKLELVCDAGVFISQSKWLPRMRKLLTVSTALASVAVSNLCSAVDITLGGEIKMGVEYGLGKNHSKLTVLNSFNEYSLSLDIHGTTDAGLRFGGLISIGPEHEVEIQPYETEDGKQFLFKATVDGPTDIEANVYNVSGGSSVSASKIVGVKINSDWHSVSKGKTDFFAELELSEPSNICKVAGLPMDLATRDLNQLQSYFASTLVGRFGIGITGKSHPAILYPSLSTIENGYLPAGRLSASQGFVASLYQLISDGAAPAVGFVLENAITVFAPLQLSTQYGSAPVQNSKFSVEGDAWGVQSASVFAGPFMEVKTASSETKLVVGAACLVGQDHGDLYMRYGSPNAAIGDAKIFVEGGFGRLSMQDDNYDYQGSVERILEAGYAGRIDPDGPVVVFESAGLLGARPFVGLDILRGDILTGGSFSLSGFEAAIDLYFLTDDNENNIFDLGGWDLGLSYRSGYSEVRLVVDSESVWGLHGSARLAGIDLLGQVSSREPEEHSKTGLLYAISAATQVGDLGVEVRRNHDTEFMLDLSYDLGGLELYASYDANDQGGSIGAKLAF